jgi:hypothetical protein
MLASIGISIDNGREKRKETIIRNLSEEMNLELIKVNGLSVRRNYKLS